MLNRSIILLLITSFLLPETWKPRIGALEQRHQAVVFESQALSLRPLAQPTENPARVIPTLGSLLQGEERLYEEATWRERYEPLGPSLDGNGQHYKVRDKQTGRTLFLKYLSGDDWVYREIGDNLYAQIDFLRQMNRHHYPYSPRLRGSYLNLGEYLFWIAMDWIEGAPITEWAKRQTQEKVLLYFGEVIKAIQAMHALHIRHRDLNPHNILIPEQGLIQIVDYANACYTSYGRYGGEGPHRTYAPPHIHGYPLKSGPFDVPLGSSKWDLYSLGIILFELVTGQPDWNKQTFAAYFLAHDTLPSDSEIAHKLPDHWNVMAPIIASALSYGFEDASAMMEAYNTAIKPLLSGPRSSPLVASLLEAS